MQVGLKIRAGAAVAAVEQIPRGRQVTVDLVVEIDGSDKPACVAQAVYGSYPGRIDSAAPARAIGVDRRWSGR